MEKFQPAQFGKYLLLDKIAVGGMAELYRAKILGVQGFEKLIAIKMILPHLSIEDDLVRSFIGEAKLAAFLQHPNIVQIYDFGRMEDRYFIAMEYLVGKDLGAVIKKSRQAQQPISLEHSLFIISQVCKGLGYAHNLRDFNGRHLAIIHRDIGPQNIFITYDGEVKIIDFGIAKASIQDRTTEAGSIKGKFAYMSPEQAEGKAVDHRSDLFSIGILLYELVLQRPMFSGDVYEIFAKARELKYEAPEDVNNNLPPKLYEILHKALAKDPEMRYQSGGDMLADIDECMAEQAYRHNERSFSTYLKEILRVEASDEKTAMQEAAQLKLIMESEPTVISDTIKSHQKTVVLPKAELERKTKPLIGFFNPVAAIALVVLVFILGLQYLKEPVSRFNNVISSFYKKNVTSDIPQTQPALSGSTDLDDPYLTVLQEGESLLKNEHFEEAVSLFEGLLAKDSAIKDRIATPYSNALLGLAQKVSETDPGKAKDIFIKAQEMAPGNLEGYLKIGLYYTKEKEFSKAIEAYEKAVSLDPNAPRAYFNLGYVFAESKDYTRAEEMYMKTVSLSPPFLDEALCNLAIIQRRLGKKDQSIKNLQEALKINPNNEIAKKYLERVK